MRAALIEPLREVYGVSDKVLTMTLSACCWRRREVSARWREVGGSMIAVDTLVHNFLHRTGILSRFGADHAYGAACYQPGGAPKSSAALPSRSTPVRSIRRSLRSSRGSSSTPSGGIAPRKASTSATAIASMIASLAATSTAKFGSCATEKY